MIKTASHQHNNRNNSNTTLPISSPTHPLYPYPLTTTLTCLLNTRRPRFTEITTKLCLQKNDLVQSYSVNEMTGAATPNDNSEITMTGEVMHEATTDKTTPNDTEYDSPSPVFSPDKIPNAAKLEHWVIFDGKNWQVNSTPYRTEAYETLTKTEKQKCKSIPSTKIASRADELSVGLT